MRKVRLPAPSPRGYGYIDQDGSWVISPRFNDCSRFVNGLAQVSVNGRLGMIDEQGSFVLDPSYRELRPYLGGLICASQPESKEWVVLNSSGDVRAGPFEWCGLFSEGLLRVKDKGQWTYLNERFEKVLVIDADWAGDRICSLIRVIRIGTELLTTFVDQRGDEVIGGMSGSFEDYSENLVLRKTNDHHYEIRDRTGHLIRTLSASECGCFSEGLCSFSENEKWGYLNTSGEIVIPPVFDEAVEFSEGFAAVRVDERWTFIDRQGKSAFQSDFERVEDFIEGYALVLDQGLRHYIDKTGRIIWRETL